MPVKKKSGIYRRIRGDKLTTLLRSNSSNMVVEKFECRTQRNVTRPTPCSIAHYSPKGPQGQLLPRSEYYQSKKVLLHFFPMEKALALRKDYWNCYCEARLPSPAEGKDCWNSYCEVVSTTGRQEGGNPKILVLRTIGTVTREAFGKTVREEG